MAVVLESVASIRVRHGTLLRSVEWFFTVLFTVEYVLRLLSVRQPKHYALSFFGVVDLLAIVPTYLSFFIVGSQSLLVIRALRLLRIFRVLKLVHFTGEACFLYTALRASSRKIAVFLGTVLTLVLIVGSAMYLIEGPESGFTSIPQAVYWAIVTMTTVGYGDVAPQTITGKFLASVIMILGYGIIAGPTGIVSVEMASTLKGEINTRACTGCGAQGHATDARYCQYCSAALG
jgi:voltage-gated potassium channel